MDVVDDKNVAIVHHNSFLSLEATVTSLTAKNLMFVSSSFYILYLQSWFDHLKTPFT